MWLKLLLMCIRVMVRGPVLRHVVRYKPVMFQ